MDAGLDPALPEPTRRVSGRVRTVVILNDFTYVQGGASRVAIDEATGLAALGLDVVFLGAVGPVGAELAKAPLRTVCLDQPQLLDVRRSPSVMLQSLWNRQACTALEAILADLDPSETVIHLHGYTKALSAMPAARAQARGFAVLCTLHDFFSACPNGAFFDYVDNIPCTRRALSWACVTAHCDKRAYVHKMFRVARGMAQRHVARFPAGLRDCIVLSRRSSEMLRPYMSDSVRLHHVPHGMAVERLPPVDVATEATLVCIGRLDEEKGVRLLAHAADALGMRIRFVGDGPLRAELEQIPAAFVTGWLTPDEVFAELGRARCLVFPSLWYETYGLVVSEAAARGVPAIVSDVSAPAERLRHGIDGWIFDSGDQESLMHALSRTTDENIVADAGQAAYAQYWQDHVSPADHAAALAELYRMMLRA